jgi:hypothetical protein
VPDSLERRVGTNPGNSTNRPPIFAGAIGIHFFSQSDLNGTLGTNQTTGVVPQTRWNETIALRNWTRPTGSKTDIVSPLPGQLVRSDGTVLNSLTLNWSADASDASHNSLSPDRRLMDGFIRAYAATPVFSHDQQHPVHTLRHLRACRRFI